MSHLIPQYDPETCRFVTTKRGYPITLRETCSWAVGALTLTCLAFALYAWQAGSPVEQWLDIRNQQLSRQLVDVQSRVQTYAKRIDRMSRRDQRLYRALLQTQPIPDHILQMGVGGSFPNAALAMIDTSRSRLLRTTAEAVDSLDRKITLQQASHRHLDDLLDEYVARLPQRPAILPANGPVTSNYGMRWHPIYQRSRMHRGIDIRTETGTPVYATGGGKVIQAGRWGGYGICVRINHGASGNETRYAHLSEIPDSIRPGVEVHRGDLIGYSGNTGLSTGPHLHYEVRDSAGESLNPVNFFVPDMTPRAFKSRRPLTTAVATAVDSTTG